MIPHETVNDDSVTLIAWLVANGEPVTEGQAVASVETSKAVMDVHSPSVGFLQTLYNPGDEVPVGGYSAASTRMLRSPPGIQRKTQRQAPQALSRLPRKGFTRSLE